MNFIPIDKMKKLREAAHNGDERAKKIISIQLSGGDFGSLLDDYFQPTQAQVEEKPTGAVQTNPNGYGLKQEKKSGLEEFLEFNGITKDSSDYQSYVDDYYKENPTEKPVDNGLGETTQECDCECKELMKKLMKEESDAIDSYSKAITQIMNSEEVNDNQKRKIISRLKEIRGDEEEHFRELNELISTCENPNEENNEGTVE